MAPSPSSPPSIGWDGTLYLTFDNHLYAIDPKKMAALAPSYPNLAVPEADALAKGAVKWKVGAHYYESYPIVGPNQQIYLGFSAFSLKGYVIFDVKSYPDPLFAGLEMTSDGHIFGGTTKGIYGIDIYGHIIDGTPYTLPNLVSLIGLAPHNILMVSADPSIYFLNTKGIVVDQFKIYAKIYSIIPGGNNKFILKTTKDFKTDALISVRNYNEPDKDIWSKKIKDYWGYNFCQRKTGNVVVRENSDLVSIYGGCYGEIKAPNPTINDRGIYTGKSGALPW